MHKLAQSLYMFIGIVPMVALLCLPELVRGYEKIIHLSAFLQLFLMLIKIEYGWGVKQLLSVVVVVLLLSGLLMLTETISVMFAMVSSLVVAFGLLLQRWGHKLRLVGVYIIVLSFYIAFSLSVEHSFIAQIYDYMNLIFFTALSFVWLMAVLFASFYCSRVRHDVKHSLWHNWWFGEKRYLGHPAAYSKSAIIFVMGFVFCLAMGLSISHASFGFWLLWSYICVSILPMANAWEKFKQRFVGVLLAIVVLLVLSFYIEPLLLQSAQYYQLLIMLIPFTLLLNQYIVAFFIRSLIVILIAGVDFLNHACLDCDGFTDVFISQAGFYRWLYVSLAGLAGLITALIIYRMSHRGLKPLAG